MGVHWGVKPGGSGGENCWYLAQAALQASPVTKTTSIKTLKRLALCIPVSFKNY